MLWRKIKQEGGWRGRGRVVRECLAEKMKLEKDLKGVKNPTTWSSGGKMVQVEGTASPRVPRQKHAWCV